MYLVYVRSVFRVFSLIGVFSVFSVVYVLLIVVSRDKVKEPALVRCLTFDT